MEDWYRSRSDVKMALADVNDGVEQVFGMQSGFGLDNTGGRVSGREDATKSLSSPCQHNDRPRRRLVRPANLFVATSLSYTGMDASHTAAPKVRLHYADHDYLGTAC